MSNNYHIFKFFLEKLSDWAAAKQALTEAESVYSIKTYHITDLFPSSALQLYESIQNKFYKTSAHELSSNWFENELRLFVWVAVCYSYLHRTKIEDLESKDFCFFAKLFPHKDPLVFEYQCRCLYFDGKNKNWSEDEQNLLKVVIEETLPLENKKQAYKIKWNDISKGLFNCSHKKFLRTAKQCRQRWNNYLDPQKIKGMWRREQCLMMFEYVQQNGKKWANIVRLLKNSRNEHSIKNKFNSLLKKQAKSNRNLTEFQLYPLIIARIRSAMSNQQSSFQKRMDFPFDDQVKQKPKTSEFANSFMKKLRNFGTVKEECVDQKYQTSMKETDQNVDHGEQSQSQNLISEPFSNFGSSIHQAQNPQNEPSNSLSDGEQCSSQMKQKQKSQDIFNVLNQENNQDQVQNFTFLHSPGWSAHPSPPQ